MKRDKGTAGLSIFLSVVVLLFMIGLIVMIFALFGGEISNATTEQGTGSIVNESQTFLYNGGSGSATSVAGLPNVLFSSLTVHRSGLMYSNIAGENYSFPNGFGSGGSVVYEINLTFSSPINSTFGLYDYSYLPAGIKSSSLIYGSIWGGTNFTVPEDIYVGRMNLLLGSRQGSLTDTCYYALIENNQSTGLPNSYPTHLANTSFDSSSVPTGSSTGATFPDGNLQTPTLISANISYSLVVGCPNLAFVDRILLMASLSGSGDTGDVISNDGGASWSYINPLNKTAYQIFRNDTHYDGSVNVTCASGLQVDYQNNPQGYTSPFQFSGTLPSGCLVSNEVNLLKTDTTLTSTFAGTAFTGTDEFDIPSNNYTQSNGYIIADQNSPFINYQILVSGDYSYQSTSQAGQVAEDTTNAIAGVTTWFPIIIVITAMVVLILLTVLIIGAIKQSGMIGSA